MAMLPGNEDSADGCTRVAVDVQLDALDTVQATEYNVAPQGARLTVWWGS